MPFLLCSLIILGFIAYTVPKRLTKFEIYATSLFALILEQMVDFYLDLKLNLYGYFNKGVDWNTLFYFPIYVFVSIIYLNLYPFSKSKWRQALYILCWAIFSLIMEQLYRYSGTFYYNGWKLWLSLILYPILYLTLKWNLIIIRKKL